MSWIWRGFGGGETRDTLIEGFSPDWANAAATILGQGSGCTIITSPVKTGTGALLLTSVGSDPAYTGILTQFVSGRLIVIMGYVNLDSSTGLGRLISPSGVQPHGYYSLLCDSDDGRVRIRSLYDVGIPVFYSPYSINGVGIAAYKHLCWIIDPITLGTNHVWHTVLIDGVVEISCDMGQEPAYYVAIPPAVQFMSDSPDVLVRLDDICAAYSTSAADAPHLAQVPIGLVDAQHPAADGTHVDWSANTGAADWTHWDDAAGNDGDTTYLWAETTSKLEDSDGESLATLGWAAGAIPLENGTGKGPVLSFIHKSVGTNTKWNALTLCNLAGVVTVTSPPTSYVGQLRQLTHNDPVGGSWARADVGNIEFGLQTGVSDHDIMWRVTTVMLQILYSEASLPLTPRPMIPQSTIF